MSHADEAALERLLPLLRQLREIKGLRENEDVKEFYLGMGGGDRKSFRDVKSYKRRKRWLS